MVFPGTLFLRMRREALDATLELATLSQTELEGMTRCVVA